VFAEERRKGILDLLTQDGRVEVITLAARFKTSEDTIRRDLRDLAAQGFLQKTHGGAVALDMPNLAWEARSQLLPAAKVLIGRAAAALVEPGQTLLLDAGLTVLEMSRQITAEPLRVITNSLDIAQAFSGRPQVSLTVAGGEWSAKDRHLSGEQTVRAIAAVRADWTFVGTCAVHPQAGVTVREEADAAVKRAMIASGLRVVLLADHAKFGQVAPHLVAPIESLHTVVSDRPVAWLADKGVRLIVAD
jgi:DeoR/GlpR family transcriptional regulator of sugar metabolism